MTSPLQPKQFKQSDPIQLKLFMTGKEWKDTITHSSDGPLEHIWPQKTEESKLPYHSAHHGSGLYDSMIQHGFQMKPGEDPPTIVLKGPDSGKGDDLHFMQSEGHHRVAAAAAVEEATGKPVYIPTNYKDTTPAARARAREAAAKQAQVEQMPEQFKAKPPIKKKKKR
jgi:hypothetical protein